MDRYLIETPHSARDCLALVQQVYAMGYLHNFDWGCKSGEHCGWTITEAENETLARLAVPPLVRAKARVIQINQFDAAMLEGIHKNPTTEGSEKDHERDV
jgi:hypothetical protein